MIHDYNVIMSDDAPKEKVLLLNPSYKIVQDGGGEPPRFKEVLDLESTAKASILVYNIGDGKA